MSDIFLGISVFLKIYKENVTYLLNRNLQKQYLKEHEHITKVNMNDKVRTEPNLNKSM